MRVFPIFRGILHLCILVWIVNVWGAWRGSKAPQARWFALFNPRRCIKKPFSPPSHPSQRWWSSSSTIWENQKQWRQCRNAACPLSRPIEGRRMWGKVSSAEQPASGWIGKPTSSGWIINATWCKNDSKSFSVCCKFMFWSNQQLDPKTSFSVASSTSNYAVRPRRSGVPPEFDPWTPENGPICQRLQLDSWEKCTPWAKFWNC